METPLGVDVFCGEVRCGRSTHVVLNPTTEQVTHLVVSEAEFPHIERVVPIDSITESTPERIVLNCPADALHTLPTFTEVEFIPSTLEAYPEPLYWMWPYGVPEPEVMTLEHERIPPDEMAVRRGAPVRATDGAVGRVDEFIVHPDDGGITHLVMREGHLWGQKEVTIPVSAIDHIEEDTVYLKLDKHSVEALPTVPVNRRWR